MNCSSRAFGCKPAKGRRVDPGGTGVDCESNVEPTPLSL